jgi:membrane-associated protease RseP (regulator of RpoE activity)
VTTLVAFLFVLGVLIFVHELGHFLAARRLGVRVLTFSLGFGPKLVNIRRGDTDYCISAIPLGGYVKMAGESGDDSRAGRPDEHVRIRLEFLKPFKSVNDTEFAFTSEGEGTRVTVRVPGEPVTREYHPEELFPPF